METMEIQPFFDPVSSTWSYVVGDAETRRCAVVDPVLDLDIVSGKLSAAGADKLIAYIRQNNFELEWILETHIHADHLTAAQYLKRKLGGKIGIGGKVGIVQASFKSVFNVESDFRADQAYQGRRACRAPAAAAIHTSEYAGRPTAAARAEQYPLPQDSTEAGTGFVKAGKE